MTRESLRMAEVTSKTWSKLFEIPTATEDKTEDELIRAILDATDCYTEEEARDVLNSEWATVCEDGIIIWMN